jgi:hypothetical protein
MVDPIYLFPFDTRFGASAIDGKPALILDYDLSVNPPYIRHIHDEIREVSPGLFLGPAMWKTAKDKVLVLWFALDRYALVIPQPGTCDHRRAGIGGTVAAMRGGTRELARRSRWPA